MTADNFADRLDAIHADLQHATQCVRFAAMATRRADTQSGADRDNSLAEAQRWLMQAGEAHDRAAVVLCPVVSDTVADVLPADEQYLRDGGWMDQDGNPR